MHWCIHRNLRDYFTMENGHRLQIWGRLEIPLIVAADERVLESCRLIYQGCQDPLSQSQCSSRFGECSMLVLRPTSRSICQHSPPSCRRRQRLISLSTILHHLDLAFKVGVRQASSQVLRTYYLQVRFYHPKSDVRASLSETVPGGGIHPMLRYGCEPRRESVHRCFLPRR